MMAKTADPRFLLEKEIENVLSERHEGYTSRYALITHSLLPYDMCMKVRERAQRSTRAAAAAESAREVVHPCPPVSCPLFPSNVAACRLAQVLWQVGVVQQSILSELSAGISKIDELDTALADRLVTDKLLPFLVENTVTPEKCHYTSKYYEA